MAPTTILGESEASGRKTSTPQPGSDIASRTALSCANPRRIAGADCLYCKDAQRTGGLSNFDP
jgi:hypothetical protein